VRADFSLDRMADRFVALCHEVASPR